MSWFALCNNLKVWFIVEKYILETHCWLMLQIQFEILKAVSTGTIIWVHLIKLVLLGVCHLSCCCTNILKATFIRKLQKFDTICLQSTLDRRVASNDSKKRHNLDVGMGLNMAAIA